MIHLVGTPYHFATVAEIMKLTKANRKRTSFSVITIVLKRDYRNYRLINTKTNTKPVLEAVAEVPGLEYFVVYLDPKTFICHGDLRVRGDQIDNTLPPEAVLCLEIIA